MRYSYVCVVVLLLGLLASELLSVLIELFEQTQIFLRIGKAVTVVLYIFMYLVVRGLRKK